MTTPGRERAPGHPAERSFDSAVLGPNSDLTVPRGGIDGKTIIRLARRRRWTTIATEALEDAELSLRARGLLAFLLSKPNDWVISADRIASGALEGRRAILSALKELERRGYLRRYLVRGDDGMVRTVSLLFEDRSAETALRSPPECAHRTPVDRTPVSSTPLLETEDLETETYATSALSDLPVARRPWSDEEGAMARALADACGLEWADLTGRARDVALQAAHELCAVGRTADDVPALAAAWEAVGWNWKPTPAKVAEHHAILWAEVRAQGDALQPIDLQSRAS